jgi:hypothetical protein
MQFLASNLVPRSRTAGDIALNNMWNSLIIISQSETEESILKGPMTMVNNYRSIQDKFDVLITIIIKCNLA